VLKMRERGLFAIHRVCGQADDKADSVLVTAYLARQSGRDFLVPAPAGLIRHRTEPFAKRRKNNLPGGELYRGTLTYPVW